MKQPRSPNPTPLDNTGKDPADRVTGGEPTTGAQRSHPPHEEPENPLESLGRAVSDTVLGSQPDGTGGGRRVGP